MKGFGDIRSALALTQAPQRESKLLEALEDYHDKVPLSEVVAYIQDHCGWCPATEWEGDKGRSRFASEVFTLDPLGISPLKLRALVKSRHSEEEVSLPLKGQVGTILHTQRLYLIQEYWMPWSRVASSQGDAERSQLILYATERIYDAINMPHLRQGARELVRVATDSPSAFSAAQAALEDSPHFLIIGEAEAKIADRVGSGDSEEVMAVYNSMRYLLTHGFHRALLKGGVK